MRKSVFKISNNKDDKIPTVLDYGYFLHKICLKEKISKDEARNKYGHKTYSEWMKILNMK